MILLNDRQSRVSGKSKVYPLETEDKNVVNETFDKMHKHGRLK